jgi:class 3 adenylate cyclase
MADSSNRTLVCSVVFLDIVGYSKQSVDEQLRAKQAFNAIVGRALKPVAARDRIVLDTGDGAAITFLGDPEEALLIAMEMREAMVANGSLPTRMGVNLGPVRLIKDINNQLNIIGDGINVSWDSPKPASCSCHALSTRSCPACRPNTQACSCTWAHAPTSTCASTTSTR